MNPKTVKYIAAACSMKKEIRTLFLGLFTVLLVLIFAIISLTQVGLESVSGALVSQDPQLAQVNIHDPQTGKIVARISEPVIWPVSGIVTLEFGKTSPYQLFHTGIDIASPNGRIGAPIGAFMGGKVTYAGSHSWGFGRHVIVSHGWGVTSIYAHLDTISVKKGQAVETGTIIGTLGNTGWSTGPHLHFQINVFGLPVNPRVFLKGDP